MLRFHVDYYKPEGRNPPQPGEALAKRAVFDAMLAKHDAATAMRRFNAVLATKSINDAIEYYGLFDELQQARQQAGANFQPLNIACVFSPPAEGNSGPPIDLCCRTAKCPRSGCRLRPAVGRRTCVHTFCFSQVPVA